MNHTKRVLTAASFGTAVLLGAFSSPASAAPLDLDEVALSIADAAVQEAGHQILDTPRSGEGK